MKKFLPLITACFLLTGQAFSQSRILGEEQKVVETTRCNSHEKYLEAIAADATILDRRAEIEANTARWITENAGQQKAVITIPVVVQLWVTTAQVSDARVQEQIDVLNKDYRRTNTDAGDTPSEFLGVAADCEIEFCLASKDPSGGATNGIIRKTAGGTPAGADIWDPASYLNLYVYSIGGGTLGFTYLPGSSPANGDAVHIDYNYFGVTGAQSPYNLGRTATHEVGHWLNLEHIWGDANCGNDQVADTPTQQGASGGCPNYPQNTCGSNDMTSNYMDYSNDNCMDVFSAGQKARMQATLSGYRASLQSSQGCSGAGAALTADFTGTPTTVTVGSTVAFTDISSGSPTSWTWTFGGGTPASSTSQNPTITYNTVGTYDVTLQVGDGSTTDTEVKTSYITVQAAPAAGSCDTTGNVLVSSGLVVGGIGGATGYSSGHNSYLDMSYAEKFTYNSPYSELNGTIIYLGVKMGTGTIDVKVWDTGATPGGTVLATQTVNISSLVVGRNYIPFASTVNITGDYYIGTDITYAAGDTIAIAMSATGVATTNTAWVQYSDQSWNDYATVYNGANGSFGIYPEICSPSTGGTTMTVTSSSTSEICSAQNGSATVAAVDGSGSYTYAWSPSGGSGATAANLSAGTYTCQVSDGTTTLSEIVVVSNDASNLGGSASATDDNCNSQNGTATAIATGGNGSYTYAWNNGESGATISSLSAGTYICDITDGNGCTTAVTAVVNANSGNLSASSTSTQEDCGQSNGSATVTASGGSAPYTYVWSNGGTAAAISGVGAGTYTCDITDANGCSYIETVTVASSSGMSASTTSTNVSCAGGTDGTATTTASGGSGAYTFTWSSGGSAASESGLSAGTYTCQIDDGAGCVVTETVVISEPTAMSSSSSTTDDQCSQSNGTATVAVSGGAGGYTYNWTGSTATGATAFNLSAGSYSCEITDMDGCTTTVSAVVGNFTANITGTTTSTDEDCGSSNGSASVTASGGTAPYTYAWSPTGGSGATASNLVAGSYSVEITDAIGCNTTSTIVVGNSGGLTGISTNGSTTCPGDNDGSVTAAAVGGSAPYTYVWSTGGTSETEANLSAGTYTCAITDAAGCAYTVSAEVQQPDAFTFYATIVNESGAGAADGSAVINGAEGLNGGYTYEWPDGSTGSSAQNLAAGNYDVAVTDLAGCQQTITISVYLGLGINSGSELDYHLAVFPNPNNGIFNVNISIAANERITVLLMNGLGQIVNDYSAEFKAGKNHMTIDMAQAPTGVYFLKIVGSNGNLTERVIKR